MKSVVDVSCFSSDRRLEMRVFDGLMGWVRLAGQTVDSYGYGMETCAYFGVVCNAWATVWLNRQKKKEKTIMQKLFSTFCLDKKNLMYLCKLDKKYLICQKKTKI